MTDAASASAVLATPTLAARRHPLAERLPLRCCSPAEAFVLDAVGPSVCEPLVVAGLLADLDRDPGSLRMVASGPGLMLHSDAFVYFERDLLGVVRVSCDCVFGGGIPGGSVPGGTSVDLGGAAIGGVLPSWL
jgi:hypothetical protein